MKSRALYQRTVCQNALIAVFVLCALGAVGCQEESRWELGLVSGTVTFQGEPVTEGEVFFQNQSLGLYLPVQLDEEGKFRFLMAEGDGLPLGDYEVAIRTPRVAFGIGETAPKLKSYPNIPPKYRDVKTSGITAKVVPGENTFQFDMK